MMTSRTSLPPVIKACRSATHLHPNLSVFMCLERQAWIEEMQWMSQVWDQISALTCLRTVSLDHNKYVASCFEWHYAVHVLQALPIRQSFAV